MGVWEVGFSQVLKTGCQKKKAFGKYVGITIPNTPV